MDGDADAADARRQLLAAVLAGRPSHEIVRWATTAQWDVVPQVAVVSADLRRMRSRDELPALSADLLVGVTGHRMSAVGRDDLVRTAATKLHSSPAVRSVALSWAAPIAEVHRGYRKTRQALDLHEIVGGKALIECSRPNPWSDLALLVDDDLLAILDEQKPHTRLVLAETLQLWLQVRESAPALAARMGTHENTVRRRLKILKQAFGDRLQDPEQTLPLLSALEANLPRWREADTSGKPRYHQHQ